MTSLYYKWFGETKLNIKAAWRIIIIDRLELYQPKMSRLGSSRKV